jgi:hypothetical protein
MRSGRSYLFLPTIGITAFYLLTIRTGHPWGDDFAQFLQHASNLAANEPYAKQIYVANPSLSIGPPAYPPVFPMMLLPIVKAAGLNFALMKLFMGLLFGAALLSIGLAFSEVLPKKQNLLLLLLVGAAPTFWTFKESVFSDVPFLVFCFLSLFLMQRMLSTAGGRKLYLLSFLTAVVMYLACGTRSQGLPLLPTLLIADAWKAKRIRLAPVLSCGLAVLFLFIQNRMLFTEGERLQYLTLDPAMVLSNVAHYAGSVSTYWDNGYSHSLRYLCFVVALVLASVGYASRLARGVGPFEAFLPLFFLPLFFWVFQQGIRYVLPIIPLYLYYIMEGARSISSRLQPRARQVTQWTLMLAAFGSFASLYTTIDLQHIPGLLDPEAQEMFRHVEANSGPDDVFLFEKPRLLGLLSHRKAAIPTREADATKDEEALGFYRKIGVDYVITSSSLEMDRQYLLPFLSRHPDWARQVWSNGAFQLWKVHSE